MKTRGRGKIEESPMVTRTRKAVRVVEEEGRVENSVTSAG
ncbi:hypothetical protein A2U01_0113546, partial [Trifolium medium]|nr:hypothetical protein [Trifolium medium]